MAPSGGVVGFNGMLGDGRDVKFRGANGWSALIDGGLVSCAQ